MIQVRSFSKIHAMAGFRVGYAVVREDGPDLRPVLGVGAPALAGALWAVEQGAARAAAPRAGPCVRASGWRRSSTSRRARAVRVAAGAGGRGAGRAADLRRAGEAWGDEEHVRVTLSDDAATERLLEALRSL